MDDSPIGKLRKYFKKIIKNCPKRFFSCLLPAAVIILLGIFILGAALNLKSLSVRDFSFLTARAYGQNLFAQPAKNFLIESPEMIIVQGNSMLAASPPATVTLQVLGTVLGGIESTDLEVEGRVNEYLVEESDTLSSVAGKFGITLNTILWANNLSSGSAIKAGQKLIILPVSGVLHLIQNGDTISGLSKMYKANAEEITAFNRLSNEGDIFIGDTLIIPGGKMPAKIPESVSVPLAESYFIFPCEGKITQGLHGPFANAVDIANKCGKLVVAAAGGVVQRAGFIAVGGNRINILHPNGVVTYYGHLSGIIVVPGQMVTAGQVIGYIGNTGYTWGTTGCHLHFEIIGAKNFLAKYPVGSNISWSK